MRTQLAGLSLKEVAAEEGTALHTVKQRRWRALQQLRQLPVAG
jgi:DNA-directed RNA polymerase specialized sigma24 family protein